MKILGIAAVAALTFCVSQAFANQGDTVTVGSIDALDNNHLTASFVDYASGRTYHFFMEARQTNANSQTKGDTTIGLGGPAISACSIHGGRAQLFGGAPFSYGGNEPFTGAPQCGTSYGETVKIDGCTALIQAHGFSHSDDPHVNYYGTVTIDVRYKRKPGNPAADQIELNIYTPKEPIKLSGNVISGSINMPSCADSDDGGH